MDRKCPLWLRIVATVIAVPVLYLLSEGPAYWLLFASGYVPSGVADRIHVVYKPLYVFRRNSKAADQAWVWYGNLWLDALRPLNRADDR